MMSSLCRTQDDFEQGIYLGLGSLLCQVSQGGPGKFEHSCTDLLI